MTTQYHGILPNDIGLTCKSSVMNDKNDDDNEDDDGNSDSRQTSEKSADNGGSGEREWQQ